MAAATEAQLAAAGFALDAASCAVAQNGAVLDLEHAVAAVKLAEARSAFE